MHKVPYNLRIETSPGTTTLISGQSYLLTCTIFLNEEENLEASAVQWLNITSYGTTSRINSNYQLSVSNLTGIGRNEYSLLLNFLEIETYHSGDYACRVEIDGIIRMNSVTISVNRMSDS